MKKLFFLSSFIILTACSSIHTISDGKKYEVQCHRVTSSDESCAEKVSDQCPRGYKIQNSEFDYVLLKGPQRTVTVICN
jgi:hypothetical protein